jgi:2'-5' RNA ligase
MAIAPTRLRLFVAAYPPASTAQRLANLAAGLELPPGRPTALEQIHLTLQFIGETDVRQLDEVQESVRRSASGIKPFALTLGSLLALPKPSGARLVAISTDTPAPLVEIVRRLAHRLARAPRRDPADRFAPHLTLFRCSGPPSRIVIPDPAPMGESFLVEDIRLMRSALLPTGARHDLVERIPLA